MDKPEKLDVLIIHLTAAVRAKDITFLRHHKEYLQALPVELQDQVDRLFAFDEGRKISVDEILRSLVAKQVPDDIDLQYLNQKEKDLLGYVIWYNQMQRAGFALIQAVLMSKKLAFKWEILKEFWNRGLLHTTWESLMQVRNRLEKGELWERGFSGSDRELITAWNTPHLGQVTLDESQNSQLEMVKQKQGALVRLKWIQRYNHAKHSTARLLDYLKHTDLTDFQRNK